MYWAIKLTKESREKLLALLYSSDLCIPWDWNIKCDHITLAHSANMEDGEWIRTNLLLSNFENTKVEFMITDYGQTDGAFAVGVSVESLNPHAHITVAVAPGHKPVESNNIEDWTSVMYLKSFEKFFETFEGYLICFE